jgi:hypothetical protein
MTRDEKIAETLAVIQAHVGGCREELGAPTYDKCWKPAEYVLWGKLLPKEALGPRCYEHALLYVNGHGLAPKANFALINLRGLAEALDAA